VSREELEARMLLLGFTHFGSASSERDGARWLRKVGFDIKGGRITVRIPPLRTVGQLDPSIAVFSFSGTKRFTYAEDAYKYILEVMNEQR